MNEQLSGRVALVTGGTQGIGEGIARVLAGQGARVIVTGVTEDECRAASENGWNAIQLDCRDQAACREAVAHVEEEFGGLSILVANAGIYPQSRLEDLSAEELTRIFETNVYGTIYMVQAAREVLAKDKRGRVIVTSSITGNVTGYPGWSHYGATKAAQMGFVRSAAMELAPEGTTVNAVLPGNILTPGLKALGQTYVDRMARAVPLGFLGTPEDIGEAVAFLASEGARYITGQSIIVDGGQILPESPEALADIAPAEETEDPAEA